MGIAHGLVALRGRAPLSALHPSYALRAIRLSNVAAVDLIGELLDQVGNALEPGMDGQRAPIGFERVLLVADLLQNDAEPGQRAEVARLARQHLMEIRDCVAEFLLGEIDGGTPVP